MAIDLASLWPAAGVLAGLQVTAFTLRINREIAVGGRGDVTWLPVADVLNLLSLVAIMLGVFISPVLGIGGAAVPGKAFGLAVLLLVGYPFALAGHYEMFNPRTSRTMTYFPRQEQIVVSAVVVAVVVYVVLAIVR